MSYDSPLRISYNFPAASFTAPVVRTLRGPAGKRGRIVEVSINATTAFVGTTTPAKLQIGDGTTVNKYADISMGTAAVPTPINSTVLMSDKSSNNKQVDPGIPDSGNIVITPVIGVGTPAGVADIVVVVEYA